MKCRYHSNQIFKGLIEISVFLLKYVLLKITLKNKKHLKWYKNDLISFLNDSFVNVFVWDVDFAIMN